MPNKIAFALLYFLVPIFALAQSYAQWPLGHVKLTGNYGELRPNHFHAGIDFSGEQGVNQPIYAVKSGYVSRIKISPYGYGKVLYITHYDGKLSVYAHQSRFNDSLENYVKREQMRQLSYEVELFPAMNELQIKEGELIGFMGNTGGSTGPHLHFEIRDEITEIPLNPLLIYKLTDTIKPVCTGLAFFDLSDSLSFTLLKAIKIKAKRDSLYGVTDSVVLNSSIIGLGFNGYDKEVANGNPNNIYEAKLYVDSQLVYHHQLNYLPFDLANYINEFSVEINKQKFQKCFTPEIYPGYLYKHLLNKGRIELKDTLYHLMRFEFKDEYGTANDLRFYVKTKQIKTYKATAVKAKNFLNCRNTYLYSSPTFTLELPAKSVYNNGIISIINNYEKQRSITVSMPNTNMRSPGKITLKLSKTQMDLAAKLVVKNNSSSIIPKVNGASLESNFKSFGKIEVLVDTVSPRLKTQVPLKKLKKTFSYADHISFRVSDNLSGIDKYNLYVNDKWVIAEYDAKSDLIHYYFDANTPTGDVNFLLTVQDRVGNTGVLKLTLKR